VTAAGIATTALRHAQAHAESLGSNIVSRVDWTKADLTTWTPLENYFDLISSHYIHRRGPHERSSCAGWRPGSDRAERCSWSARFSTDNLPYVRFRSLTCTYGVSLSGYYSGFR
jgi:hypothetical protein